MLAAQALGQLRSLPVRTLSALEDDGVAILAPHPDDESLGCGGLIAALCAQGRPPLVLILTDGTGSHPNSRLFPAERLRAVREAETLAATGALGLPPERLVFLGYRDTAAPASGAALRAAAERLAGLARDAGCGMLLAPWRHDPHCDHAAAAAIAEVAAAIAGLRLLAYPVWGLTLPAETVLPDEAISGFRLDVSRHLERKRAAIQAHASQYAGIIDDDPGGFQMEPGFIELFLQDSEIFLEILPAAGAVS